MRIFVGLSESSLFVKIARGYRRLGGFLFFIGFSLALLAEPSFAKDVAFAGIAYSGDAVSIDKRFPQSKRFERQMLQQGSPVNKLLREAVERTPPKAFGLVGQIAELKGNEQVISVAMMVNNETVSVERFGSVYKLLLQIRAQAVFFDFKSMTVLRAYPFSLAYLDILAHEPSQTEIDERVRALYLGTGEKPGLFNRFAGALAGANLPDNVPRFVQVSKVEVAEPALASLTPQQRATAGSAETWVADMFAESLSSKVGIPVLPYSKGYAISKVMALTVADGNVYNLTLPDPDYVITLSYNNVKKIKTGESAAGASYVYGSYLSVKIEEPVSGVTYLKSDFKNGEIKEVPVTQNTVDDAPAYADSVRGLFAKLTSNLGGSKTDWLQDAASAPDINKQVQATYKLFQSCK